MEDIVLAKNRGAYKGRKAVLSQKKVETLKKYDSIKYQTVIALTFAMVINNKL